ncbi:MAG: ribosome maturation factor RimP [Rhodothermaceae bacterium]
MNKKEEILNITEQVVSRYGYLLIDVVFRGDHKNRIIEIFIDHEKDGVTTKTCASISREIGEQIDEEELIASKYRLDVSSPGVDRPLKFIQQFVKNIDRKFEIEHTTEEGAVKFEGKLKSVEENKLTFIKEKEEIVIDFPNIKSAKVLISF